MFNSKDNGFSLVELIVVLIITAILAQLGYSAFNRYVRRTRAFAAKTALKNIQRECESNRDLEAPETFTLLPIRGYSIATRDTNSCLGQSSDGKVAAIADNQDEIPNYFYDFLLGQISCSFNNSSTGLFQDCINENKVSTVQSILKFSKEEKSQNLKCNFLNVSNNPEFLAESKKEGANPKSLANWYRNICEEFKQEVALCGSNETNPGYPCSNLCSNSSLNKPSRENWCGENEYSVPDWMDQNKMNQSKEESDAYIKNLVENMRRLNVMEIVN